MTVARLTAGVVLAAVAVFAGAFLAGPSDPGWQPRFHAFHVASDVDHNAFREGFAVHDVDPAFQVATASVQIRLDGVPLRVNWTDGDGLLGDGDGFWFVQEAFDRQQVLTGWHGGVRVMECRFGGGAGMGYTPQEWRDMGQPEQVRCLDRLPDG